MFDWLRKNAHRLAAAHPEGYASWGVLFDHLVSQGGLTTRVCIALKALVAGWENTSMQNSAVSDAFWKASAQEYLVSTPPVSIADTCTGLECVGSDLQSRGEELLRWFSRKLSDDGRSELISELCQGAYPHLARAVACCFLDAYTVHSVSIAVHYGFADILKERVQDPDRSHVINSPGVNPKSPHRLSKNDNANAWLWLIKGDGDVTKKMWDMIQELKLIRDYAGNYGDFFAGVYRSGAKINVDSFNPPLLRRMIGEVHVDALKCLVESGVDIISLCPTALHHARDLDTAKYLVQCGATLCADENGRTPLHWAKSADVVDFLIEMGADVSAVNDAGKTPLHCTAYIDVAKSLIAHKADIHARDNDGKTPLHSVYSDGIVQLLINHKADVSALDNTGKTPLHYLKYGDSVEILVENGADIEAVDEEGRTPFMAAFCGTHPYLYSYYECFHRCGANPNAVDANGRTALHSLSREFSCYVSILVEMKADPNARDNDGKTPLDLAVDSSVISQLKLVGARFSASNNMTLNEKKQGAGEVEVGRG
jgi:ankyrin repeat protein